MALEIIQYPQFEGCLLSPSGNPVVYKFLRKDYEGVSITESGGNALVTLSGAHASEFTVGDLVVIYAYNNSDGYYRDYASITAKADVGLTTVLHTDLLYNGDISSFYLNNLSAKPLYNVKVLYNGTIFRYYSDWVGQVLVDVSIINNYFDEETINFSGVDFTSPGQQVVDTLKSFQIEYAEAWQGNDPDEYTLDLFVGYISYGASQFDSIKRSTFFDYSLNDTGNKFKIELAKPKIWRGLPFAVSAMFMQEDSTSPSVNFIVNDHQQVNTGSEVYSWTWSGSYPSTTMTGYLTSTNFVLYKLTDDDSIGEGVYRFSSYFKMNSYAARYRFAALDKDKNFIAYLSDWSDPPKNNGYTNQVEISNPTAKYVGVKFEAISSGGEITLDYDGSSEQPALLELLNPEPGFVIDINRNGVEQLIACASRSEVVIVIDTDDIDSLELSIKQDDSIISEVKEFEIIEPCNNPILLCTRSLLGGILIWCFEGRQEVTYVNEDGERKTQVKCAAAGLTLEEFKYLQSFRTASTLKSLDVSEFDSNTLGTKSNVNKGITAVDSNGNKQIVAYIDDNSVMNTGDTGHYFELTIELPKLFEA